MKSGFLLLFAFGAIGSNVAHALKEPLKGKLVLPNYQTVSACGERPDFLSESRTELVGSIDKLPQMGLLVAREAEYYIDGKTEGGLPVRVHGYQSFVAHSKNQILCGAGAKGVQERFSLIAPTLIDTTVAQKTGSSLWQFQILAKEDQFSAWNIKSPLGAGPAAMAKALSKPGTQYHMYQVGYNEYEMMVIRESKGVKQYLSVRYDAVAKY
jgi:hypothetical protein